MEAKTVLTIVALCMSLALLIFIAQLILFFLHVKKSKISTLAIACAGSPQPETASNIRIEGLPIHKFHTETDERINSDEYLKFYVQGWSMLLCGIRNNDILFAKGILEAEIKRLSFDNPKVLILKREGKSLEEAIAKGDYAKYKVRRTWAMLPFDEAQIMAKVDEIMQSKIFLDLKTAHPENFLPDEEIKNDCRTKRIANYIHEYSNCEKTSSKDNLVIISTTLRKIGGESKVFFSIHPARTIVGETIYAFHKEEETQVS